MQIYLNATKNLSESMERFSYAVWGVVRKTWRRHDNVPEVNYYDSRKDEDTLNCPSGLTTKIG